MGRIGDKMITKNIKKKLKGFQVRPPNVEVIKKVLLHIPYVVVFYVVNKKNNSTNLEKNKKDKDTKLSEKKVLFQNKFLN